MGHSEPLLLITHIPNHWWKGTHLHCCVGLSPWAVGSPAEHTGRRAPSFSVSWPAEDSVFISHSTTLRNPRSRPQAEPLQEFSGSNVRNPCPSHGPTWDAAGHGAPQQLSAVPTLGQGTCLLVQLFPISPAFPKTLFCCGCLQACCGLLWLRTTHCLLPIAAVLHS